VLAVLPPATGPGGRTPVNNETRAALAKVVRSHYRVNRGAMAQQAEMDLPRWARRAERAVLADANCRAKRMGSLEYWERELSARAT
jgi:hypothetical protein